MKNLEKVDLSLKIEGYYFECYKLNESDLNDNYDFPDKPGTYIFGKQKKTIKTFNELLDENYIPVNILYCGKAENLRTRFYEHHIIDDLSKDIPCLLCYHQFKKVEDAESLESIIIKKYSPKLNTQQPSIDD